MPKTVDILLEELKDERKKLMALRHQGAEGEQYWKLTREINELSRVIYIITKRAT